MLPDKGLYQDSNEFNQPKGTWIDARNILKDKKKRAITSDLGTVVTATGYPFATAKPIGTTVFPDGSYVVYSDGINGGQDRLGVVETNGVYSDIIIDNLLNFSQNYPIRSSEFDYNFLKQRIISWTDKNNVARIANIDNLGFALTVGKAFITATDLNKLNLFPSFKSPNIVSTILNSGGSIKAGHYTFAIKYKNIDGTITNYSPFQSSVYVVEDITGNVLLYDGTPPGSFTGKSIQIQLTGLDISYNSFVLVAISTINGVKTAFEIKEEIITGPNMTITYIGSETPVTLSLEEVLTSKPIYTKVGAMAQLHNVLYLADLETQEDFNFQEVANQIKIYYNSTITSANNLNAQNLPTFGHKEVYAFYIVFVLNNGSLSKAYHIPGRPVIPGQPDPLANITVGGIAAKRYQIRDTTNQSGTTYTTVVTPAGTTISPNQSFYSNMGYWENENEEYPSNWPGGLGGQRVRHHVFPSYQECRTRHYNSNPEYLKSQLDILGIDTYIPAIPVEMQGKFSGYFICYAKKDYEDCINYGLDLLQFSAKNPTVTDNIEWDTAYNNESSYDGTRVQSIEFNSIRSHIRDLLKDKPQLSTSQLYLRLEARYRYFGSRDSKGDVVSPDNSGFIYLLDYINRPIKVPGVVSGVKREFPDHVMINTLSTFPVTEFRYLANGVLDGNKYNLRSGESIYLKSTLYERMNEGNPPNFSFKRINYDTKLGITFIPTGLIQGNEPTPTDFIEETYLYSLCQVKSNVHSLYDQQILTICSPLLDGTVAPPLYTKNHIGYGDRFIGPITKMHVGSTSARPSDITNNKARAMTIRYHICESRYNTRLRYEVDGNENTKYYPKTNASNFYLKSDDRRIQFNFGSDTYDTSGFKSDYKETNYINQALIYNPNKVNQVTNKFPFRVIRSGVAGTNFTGLNSWKTFLSNDFYDKNRNRGEIVNLAVLDDVLLIHHRYGLFRTIGANRLSFDSTEVFLGAGDIFSQEPKEPIPSRLGYLGVQNIFGCCSFLGGYSWLDQNTGRVFIIGPNGVQEISNFGMFNFFRDNCLIDNTFPDNPITGQGIMTCYDPMFKRLIFSKKSNTNPFTISFSLSDQQWVGYHDYTPDYMFFNNKTFFGFKDNKIHQFNVEGTICKYFGNSVQPSYIDLVFNDYQQDDKIFFNTFWTSEMFDSNNQLIRDKTISHIQLETNYQQTGEIVIQPHSDFNNPGNTRAAHNTWNFNKMKDANADVYKKKPLVGVYAKVRFKYDNAPNLDLTQNSLYLYDFGVKIRKAEL